MAVEGVAVPLCFFGRMGCCTRHIVVTCLLNSFRFLCMCTCLDQWVQWKMAALNSESMREPCRPR